ncbi:MAG TPA: 2-succinyl-5-enolpyruvyl-6-hydroxy-3-cyclohexene-1-carboxylic-acid synthase [Solirubrobacterales bacterium]|nr:2-succinyl-5-enolpyruvyl-6-hydroxy-3-cyclohexene-1-carboxylic-acid synthase [Solirubrobacterales bacterium]
MERTNRNTALASALVEELARCGVREAAVAPGSRSSPLSLALLREPAIRVTSIVDERCAGFFALGAAQASGTPAVVLCTSGTAAANLHPAVAEADESNVPLIVLTADRPPELRGIGAGQTIDQIKLYGSAVRWFSEVGTHEANDAGLLHYRSVGCRAFAAAAGDARPGPVHLNLAWRDPLGPEPRPEDVTATSELALSGREGDRPLTTVPSPPPAAPAPELVEALAKQLGASERGVIVAGRMLPGAAAAIAELAVATGFPVLAEPTSQLRFGPHDRNLVVSAYDPIVRLRPAGLEPDLVLRFGEMPTCKPLRQWLTALPATTQLVVDPTGLWNEPTRTAGAIVRADPAALCRALVSHVEGRSREGWAERWCQADRAGAEAIATALGETDELNEPGLHAALGDLYRDGELVYTASSMPIRDQEAFLRGGEADVVFLANRGANGIDGLVSSGIGAAAATGRRTWILTGDLGLFHDMNALAILRTVDADVRIVVANNDGGGIFEFLPQAGQVAREEFETVFGTPLGLDLERVAGLFGVRFARIERLVDLENAVADPGLIEVPVDRRRSVELHREVNERASQAVAEALARDD